LSYAPAIEKRKRFGRLKANSSRIPNPIITLDPILFRIILRLESALGCSGGHRCLPLPGTEMQAAFVQYLTLRRLKQNLTGNGGRARHPC